MPKVATSGKRQSISAISVVSARGAFWDETYAERLNRTKRFELLKHLFE